MKYLLQEQQQFPFRLIIVLVAVLIAFALAVVVGRYAFVQIPTFDYRSIGTSGKE